MPPEASGAANQQVDPSFLEESAEDLYENAPCGYLSTLPDGLIVRVNRTFETMTGFRREELVGQKRLVDMLPAGGKIYHETHYAPLLQMQGSVRELAMELVCADGKELPVLVSSVVKKGDDGRPAVIRVMILSARDRRNYERELLSQRRRAEESEARARTLARTLQASFIPPAVVQIPGLDLAGVYRPAGRGDEVGGDFYDVFENHGGDLAVVIGDVSGKGAEAATVTALARYTIRAAAAGAKGPRDVLETLNTAMIHQKVGRMCSVVYCRVRREEQGRFRVCLSVAGHPGPLLLEATSEDAQVVEAAGLMLGILDDPAVEQAELELGPGDCLLLYTDGVTEARRSKEFFGESRLVATLKALRNEGAAGIAGGIAAEVLDFQHGLARDDIAVVALKVPVAQA